MDPLKVHPVPRRATTAALLVTLAVGTTAGAQGDPFVRPIPSAAVGTDVLGRFLRELGHDPKALSPDVYQVSVERDKWPVHVMLSLSTDGQRVWLESKFAPVADPDKVAPGVWKRLLEANEKIGPAHFAFDPGDKRIHLYKSIDNKGLSTDRLRREIDSFDQTVRKTQEYWRGDNFKAVPDAVPLPTVGPEPVVPLIPKAEPTNLKSAAVPVSRVKSDFERLAGPWTITEIRVRGRKTPDEVLSQRKPTLEFRPARDGDPSPPLKGKIVADLHIGTGSTRTVFVRLGDFPGTIDFLDAQERLERGLFKLDGDELTLCFAAPGDPRPTDIAADEARTVITLRRK